MPPKKSGVDMTKNSINDIVLGQLKGFPKWPCRIVDPQDTNDQVRSEMPGKGKSSHLLCFFPKGDFAWVSPKDIYPLPEKDIRAFLDKNTKSNGELRRGYEVALNPDEWFAQKAEEDAQRQQAWEEEMMHVGGEGYGEYAAESASKKAAAGGKRKRASEASPKMRVNADDARKKKGATSKTTAKSKSKSYAEDEDEGPSKKKAKASDDNDPPGLKQLKEWRHKLQRAFLGDSINPEEMPKCAEYFDAMEIFDCNREWFIESKLGKVFKRLATLTNIPHDTQYQFRDRTVALVAKWAKVEDSAVASGSNGVVPAPLAPAPIVESAPIAEAAKVEPVIEAPIIATPAVVEAAPVAEAAPAITAEPVDAAALPVSALTVDAPAPASNGPEPVLAAAPAVIQPLPL